MPVACCLRNLELPSPDVLPPKHRQRRYDLLLAGEYAWQEGAIALRAHVEGLGDHLRRTQEQQLAALLEHVGDQEEHHVVLALVHALLHRFQEILLALYLAGALLTLALFLVSALKIRRLIRSGVRTEREGCHLVLLESEVPSFSWGRKVVMSRKDFLQSPAIFTHELMHVQRHHSLDLLLFLPLQCLFWWNPLLWVTREELRLLHEYEADEGVLQKGIDATQYQLLLVLKAVGEERFSLASGFQHAKLKNRISMMKQSSSSGWMRLGYLALIPVLAAFMFACNPGKNNKAQAPAEDAEEAVASKQVIVADEASEAAVNAGENEKEAIPYQLIEQKPGFNGGDAAEFSKWVNGQIKYPEQAKKEGIHGRVVLQFTVGEDGQVRDAKVLRGVHDALDAEALRVVSASPKWEPGRNKGKAVSVIYTFPVVFKIQ